MSTLRNGLQVIHWAKVLWQKCENCRKNTMFFNEHSRRFSCRCKNPIPGSSSIKRMYKKVSEIK